MACALAADLAACYSRPLEPPTLAVEPAEPGTSGAGPMSPGPPVRTRESVVEEQASSSAMSSPDGAGSPRLGGAQPAPPLPGSPREGVLYLPAPCAGIPYSEQLR